MSKINENIEIGNTGIKFEDLIENDSGWITMTLDSNFSGGAGKPPQYRKIRNYVYLKGLLYLKGTMPTGRYFATLPEEYRPSEAMYLNAYYSGTTENANVIILSTGKLQASSKMTTSNSYFLSLDGLSFFTD